MDRRDKCVKRELPLIFEDGENKLSGFFREMLGEMAERLKLLYQRIRQYDFKVERVFGQDERCRRLARVEGVGVLVATALQLQWATHTNSKTDANSAPGLACTLPTFQRRPQCAFGYQQARRQLPTYVAHSRSPLGGTHR